jgi:hypothetical protein
MLKKITLLVATLLLSTKLLAVPILQNQEDKQILSNPDANETPLLIDNAITDKKQAKLYYPWNAIKILTHKDNKIPKLSFTANSKLILITITVSLDIRRQQIKEAVKKFKAEHPNIDIQLKPIHPEIGKYIFALSLANGKRYYFHKTSIKNTLPSNQVVMSLGLAGNQARNFINALMNGAIMEIHYQYQFTALSDAQKIPVRVHSKLELNGYCEAFPSLFNHQLTGQFEQGCLPNMEITDIQ